MKSSNGQPQRNASNFRFAETPECVDKITNDTEWDEDGERLNKSSRELDITIFTYVMNGNPVILLLVRDVTHRSYIKLL